MTDSSPKEIVRQFLETVRSGREPDLAAAFFAPRVLAHQLNGEAEVDVMRTPSDYSSHVREMQATFGAFTFAITELLAEGDRVYARWRQVGTHIAAVEGIAPTGKQVVELASAVYRVENGLISEYWIQVDRAGVRAQLATR